MNAARDVPGAAGGAAAAPAAASGWLALWRAGQLLPPA
jgi:hypothetical protein